MIERLGTWLRSTSEVSVMGVGGLKAVWRISGNSSNFETTGFLTWPTKGKAIGAIVGLRPDAERSLRGRGVRSCYYAFLFVYGSRV